MTKRTWPVTEDTARILEARKKELGLTYEEIGRRSKTSKVSVRAVLKFGVQQSDRLEAICEALEVPLSSVLPLDPLEVLEPLEYRWLEAFRDAQARLGDDVPDLVERIEHTIAAEIALAEAKKKSKH